MCEGCEVQDLSTVGISTGFEQDPHALRTSGRERCPSEKRVAVLVHRVEDFRIVVVVVPQHFGQGRRVARLGGAP